MESFSGDPDVPSGLLQGFGVLSPQALQNLLRTSPEPSHNCPSACPRLPRAPSGLTPGPAEVPLGPLGVPPGVRGARGRGPPGPQGSQGPGTPRVAAPNLPQN